MQATLRILLLCGLIYSAIAASGFQSINFGGGGGAPPEWSDSAHNSDVDNLLRRLEKFDNDGNDRNNWGNNFARSSGLDTDRSKESREDAFGMQFINLG
ncbi:uncharacterized protein LOC108100831 [Drosophila ficusphila]|uniref:uncharacterized protein LOC108100831 n=1 Tax=Drosophila ficusphila TaxID=30025 RepID=UPI0007E642A9|nr:uncharacterized protein LOC108100831 [Drosophila ficusphila]